jgi:hypothetical protein
VNKEAQQRFFSDKYLYLACARDNPEELAKILEDTNLTEEERAIDNM